MNGVPVNATLRDELMGITAGRVRFNEPMRLHTTFHIGGPAQIWVEPAGLDELRGLLKLAREATLAVTVIGGGANLLVRDEGIPGLVVHLGSAGFQSCRRTAPGLVVGAGLPIEWMIRRAQEEGLTGVEFLAGVPGRIGGAVRMNAGTHDDQGQRHSFSDVIRSVTLLDLDGNLNVCSPETLGFGYRQSRFGPQLVIEAELNLQPDDPTAVAERVKRLWAFKKQTQDWSAPSVGCIFKNLKEGQAAGWLIDRAGLKGTQRGMAAISKTHANFMMNLGSATAADVFALIEEVQTRVRKQFGIELELEVQVLPREASAAG